MLSKRAPHCSQLSDSSREIERTMFRKWTSRLQLHSTHVQICIFLLAQSGDWSLQSLCKLSLWKLFTNRVWADIKNKQRKSWRNNYDITLNPNKVLRLKRRIKRKWLECIRTHRKSVRIRKVLKSFHYFQRFCEYILINYPKWK